MLIISYTPNDSSCRYMPDGEVQYFVQNIINYYKKISPEGLTVDVGQELIITEFRVAVKQKLIDHNEIIFKFDDQLIPINEAGRLSVFPDNFLSQFDRQLDILLDL
jgi:hypothetical protein